LPPYIRGLQLVPEEEAPDFQQEELDIPDFVMNIDTRGAGDDSPWQRQPDPDAT